MDDGLANDLSTADDSINGDEVSVPDYAADSDASDMSDDYPVSYAGDHKSHSSHHKTDFANDNKKPDHRTLNGNGTKKAKPQHKHPVMKYGNATDDKKAKPHHRHPIKHSQPANDKKAKHHHEHVLEIVAMSDYRPQASHAEIEQAIMTSFQDAERTVASDQLYCDATNRLVKSTAHNADLTKESELCACSDAGSCHEDDCPLCGMDDSTDSFTVNDASYSCSNFYTQINTAGASLVRFQEEDEEELIDERALKSTEKFISSPYADETAGNGEYSQTNLNICLTDSLYGDASQFAGIGLDIEGLYSPDLDIKDYNLEYYMFSNPDIIINANIYSLPKTNTSLFNTDFYRCHENPDAKTTESPCVSEDDYADFYYRPLSLNDNEQDNLNLIKADGTGHSPINLSCGQAFSSNFGGIERCLI